MKNKWKAIWAAIVTALICIGAAIIYWIKSRTKSNKVIIKEGGIQVKRKENGTQILPKTPELNKTIDSILKDINTN